LTLNGMANYVIFYETQLGRGDFSFVEFAPRLEEMLWTKQAADMIGTKWRFPALRYSFCSECGVLRHGHVVHHV
jgi:hypothetical protein